MTPWTFLGLPAAVIATKNGPTQVAINIIACQNAGPSHNYTAANRPGDEEKPPGRETPAANSNPIQTESALDGIVAFPVLPLDRFDGQPHLLAQGPADESPH